MTTPFRFTTDHRGRTVATTQPAALDRQGPARTELVARFPDGTEASVTRGPRPDRLHQVNTPDGRLEAKRLADLLADLRATHPGTTTHRRPRS